MNIYIRVRSIGILQNRPQENMHNVKAENDPSLQDKYIAKKIMMYMLIKMNYQKTDKLEHAKSHMR